MADVVDQYELLKQSMMDNGGIRTIGELTNRELLEAVKDTEFIVIGYLAEAVIIARQPRVHHDNGMISASHSHRIIGPITDDQQKRIIEILNESKE